jgi:ribosome-associated protein
LTSIPEVKAASKKISRITRGSRIIKVIIKAIQDKKGENLISMDLHKIPEAVADFFIICEAGSTTQVKAIADHIRESVREACGEKSFHDEGYGAMQWVIVDYVNVVVHIFLPETRRFYRLEEMWSDADVQEHLDGPVKEPSGKKPSRQA